ncbi:MAG TPA: ABC transporter permease [Ignavibacteria bacterium]|nr:ABC transporter permease [Ignavibacteria bacterium]
MLSKIYSISKKEFWQISRDKRTLMIIFILPVSLLVLFGYAITLDINTIKLGVFDKDRTEASRDFINGFIGSSYFKIISYVNADKEVNELLDRGKVQCVVVVPENFSKDLADKRNVKVQFLIDGVDANTATIILNYVNAATRFYSTNFTKEFLDVKGIKQYQPLNIDTQFWYNKDLDTTQFFIPGLIAMLLIIISVILTSISLVREKELGTLEQIRVSPVTSLELIFGKIIPYLIISLLIAYSILFIGYILFGVVVKGSHLFLFLGTICYLMATLSMGVLISTIADSQQVAFQMAQLLSQLPTVILSGFIFPIESMPWPVQILTNITPAKFYIVILRDILIKGVGFEAYKMQMVYLIIFATILIAIAVFKTKKANAV